VGEGERKHQEWVRANLNEKIETRLKELPYIIIEKIEGITFAFMHYARKDEKFIYIKEEKTVDKLDEMFNCIDSDVIIYGHEHDLIQKKLVGKSTYICVGSSGCSKDRYTYYTILNIEDKNYSIERVEIKYDREKFLETFSAMNYPDKDFISRVFFGIDSRNI
jgi:predicted phosphodiesterase